VGAQARRRRAPRLNGAGGPARQEPDRVGYVGGDSSHRRALLRRRRAAAAEGEGKAGGGGGGGKGRARPGGGDGLRAELLHHA
jgi:hypothetical protein